MPGRVHVAHTVLSEILTWARQAQGREIGGILLGRVHRGRALAVRVEAALLAQGADSVGSSIRFTPELVSELSARGQSEYPSFQVVGWFHTHCGLGAFLSGYDMAVHKEHFSEPWQVALVLDTELGREALYGWEGGAIVPVAAGAGTYAVGETAATAAPALRPRWRLVKPRRLLVVLLAGVLLVAALVGLTRLSRHSPAAGEVPAAAKAPAGAAAAPGDGEGQREGQAGAEAAAPIPGEGRPAGTEEMTGLLPAPDASAGQKYIVRPGDTLWGISERFYGQGDFYLEVSRHNRLANPRLILPGQQLILPPKEPQAAPVKQPAVTQAPPGA